MKKKVKLFSKFNSSLENKHPVDRENVTLTILKFPLSLLLFPLLKFLSKELQVGLVANCQCLGWQNLNLMLKIPRVIRIPFCLIFLCFIFIFCFYLYALSFFLFFACEILVLQRTHNRHSHDFHLRDSLNSLPLGPGIRDTWLRRVRERHSAEIYLFCWLLFECIFCNLLSQRSP